MRVLVFGASGATGQELVHQALAAGHDVTAVARNPNVLRAAQPAWTIVQGDILERDAVVALVAGHDAVISAVGSGRNLVQARKPTSLYSQGMANVLAGMRQHAVERVIAISSSGPVLNRPDPIYNLVFKPLLRETYADMQRMEALLRASEFDWTIVRAAFLTRGPRTGQYRVAGELPPERGWKVSRADLAHCIVAQLDRSSVFQSVVTAAY